MAANVDPGGYDMSYSQTLAHSSEGRDAHLHASRVSHGRSGVARFVDRSRRDEASQWPALASYRAGWAEADPSKIVEATAPGYRLHDPLVGSFSRRSLCDYFDALQDRLSSAGTISRSDVAFFLRGPMDQSSGGLQFWREAPRIGLSGVTRILFGEDGVIAETVAYDLNLACELLRRTPARRSGSATGAQNAWTASGPEAAPVSAHAVGSVDKPRSATRLRSSCASRYDVDATLVLDDRTLADIGLRRSELLYAARFGSWPPRGCAHGE
jgi:hypothetical protein